MHERRQFRYQPFYCEENAWWLCGEPTLAAGGEGEPGGGRQVLFVSNRIGRCPFACQRAAPPGRLLSWDYHCVVLDEAARIWDPDTRLGMPLPARDWLQQTFPFIRLLGPALAPKFRLVPADDYRRHFGSDRRHMRTRDGGWHHPPPPWPPIGNSHTLPQYLQPPPDGPGTCLDWHGLMRWLEPELPAKPSPKPPVGAAAR
ncbi:hypothetical protein [Thiohalocapsa marina]|nr:hypothetical protein [Thiohalocapsa marina]